MSVAIPLPAEAIQIVKRSAVKALGGPGSGNFGHAGRPGQIGGSAPMSGAMKAIRESGGFTVHAVTGAVPTTGYALSLHPERERKIAKDAVTVDTLAQYTVENWDLLSQKGNYLGGWYNPDDGQVYLDVSTIVSNADEANDLGFQRHQLAFYDLTRGVTVPVHEPALKAAAHGQNRIASDRTRGWHTDARRPHRTFSAVTRARSDRRGVGARQRDSSEEIVTLGGSGSGNFGHAGRPGRIGGSSKRESSDVVQRFKDAIEPRKSGSYGQIFVADSPGDTAFLLPDGTRIGHSYDTHVEAANRLLNTRFTFDAGTGDPERWDALGEVMRGGVARITPDGGVQIGQPLTESQAQIIADDWNYVWDNTLFIERNVEKEGKLVELEFVWQNFEPPINVDALRRWSKNPTGHMMRDTGIEDDDRSLGGPGSGHHGHAGRPGQIGGSAPARERSHDADILAYKQQLTRQFDPDDPSSIAGIPTRQVPIGKTATTAITPEKLPPGRPHYADILEYRRQRQQGLDPDDPTSELVESYEPEHRGPIQRMQNQLMHQSFDENRDIETLAAVAKDGKLSPVTVGSDDRVVVPDNLMNQWKLDPPVVLAHTHPSSGAPSFDDLLLQMEIGTPNQVIFGKDGSWHELKVVSPLNIEEKRLAINIYDKAYNRASHKTIERTDRWIEKQTGWKYIKPQTFKSKTGLIKISNLDDPIVRKTTALRTVENQYKGYWAEESSSIWQAVSKSVPKIQYRYSRP